MTCHCDKSGHEEMDPFTRVRIWVWYCSHVHAEGEEDRLFRIQPDQNVRAIVFAGSDARPSGFWLRIKNRLSNSGKGE